MIGEQKATPIGIRVAILTTALLALVLTAFWAQPQTNPVYAADTIVRCEPAIISGDVAENLVFDIYVQDVVDLYGVDIEMTFDTTIANVVDILPLSGFPGVQIEPLSDFLQPDFLYDHDADNTVGTINYRATQDGFTHPDPVDGSGSLARVTLENVQAGSFAIGFNFSDLSDKDGFLIPNETQSCSVYYGVPLAVHLASAETTSNLPGATGWLALALTLAAPTVVILGRRNA